MSAVMSRQIKPVTFVEKLFFAEKETFQARKIRGQKRQVRRFFSCFFSKGRSSLANDKIRRKTNFFLPHIIL